MAVWQKELITFILLFLVVAIVGFLTGSFLWLSLLLTTSVLLYELLQISRFEKWLNAGARSSYPKSKGIWEEVYYHVYRIKKNDKKRKKKLSKMVDQFRQSTEALPDAAVVLGANDEIEWTNKAARDVFGLQQNDRGQRIPNLVRFPEFIRYINSGDYSEPVIVPSPVNHHIMLSIRIVPYGAGLRLLLAQDVTQLKLMERMRKDFVANVSHELRTPLTVLKGYLETLREVDEGDSAVLTASLHQMYEQTERMQHLVDDLLLLTRLESQQKKAECVKVPLLLTRICEESNSLSAGRVKLSLETNKHIMGDEQELRSAFTNLLNNALKYSPEDTPVKVRWFKNNDVYTLSVEDQGEGIAKADINRVTERFYRVETKRSKKVSGTGLGLAIVKHVLMRHDAQLDIQSELHKGSCFSCHFSKKRICSE
ncbi:two-component system, OmpR family, phosphate regulon sensor histidine kinase PhoR [Candidatus Brocadiaceae bacterium]|nr:two-component system, OmpR family, phosphate regulon sensor histidine kinase PhoR [Candidatus Brocadiaceae bacterium]